MSTHSKLWLGFGLPTGLLLLSVVLIFVRLSAITEQVGELAKDAQQRAAIARQVEVDVGDYSIAVQGYLFNPNPFARESVALAAEKVEQGASAYQRMAATERQELLASGILSRWRELRTAGDELLDADPVAPPEAETVANFNRLREALNTHLNGSVHPEAVEALNDSRAATLTDAMLLKSLALYLAVIGTLLATGASVVIGRAVLAAEQNTLEQSERLRTTLASIGDAVITTDTDANVTGMNPVAESLTGWSLEQAEGKPLSRVFNIINEDTRQPVENPATRALEAGAIVGLANHTILIAKDGTERPIDDSAAPIRCKLGEIVGCVLVFRDVAERREAEEEVRESARFTRRVLDNLFGFVGVLSPDGTLTQLNKAPLEAAGLERADVVGKKFWDCYWWSFSEESQTQLQEALLRARRGEVVRYDVQVRMAGGVLMWIDFQVAALRDEAGQVTHLIPSGFDISARKQAEMSIAKAERLQRLAIEAGGIGYWDWDLVNKEVVWGPGARELYGMPTPPGPQNNELAVEPILAEDRERVLKEAADAIAAGEPFRSEFRVKWPDESIHWLHAQGEVSDWGPDGEPIRMIGVNFDITARKQSEVAVRESENRLRMLADNVPAMLFATDEQNECTFLNAEWSEYTGQSLTQSLGSGWLDAIHEDDRDRAAKTFLGASERRESYRVDYRLRTAQGDYRWCVAHGRPRFSQLGHFRGYIGSVVDIHDRYEAAKALEESESQAQLLLQVVQNSPDFIGVSDLNGKPIFVNDAGLKLVGAKMETIGDTPVAEYFPPEERERVLTEVLPAARDGGHWAGELHFQHFVTGEKIPVLYDVFRVDSPETGKPTHFATITSDISAEIESRAALKESEERFRRVVDDLPLLVWMHSPDGGQSFLNRTYLNYFGVTEQEMERDRWTQLIHPDDLKAYREEFLDSIRHHRPFRAEVRVLRRDGDWRWLQSWARPRFGANDVYLGHIGVSADITDRKNAEEALQEADRQKDEFLATLAHELRNPLAPIRTGLELMALKAGNPEAIEDIRATMQRQTEQLIVLVDDLMDISRITRGDLELRRSKIRLRDVIQEAVESSRWLIDKAGHDLTIELPQESLFIDADPHRMVQVVSNLLNNAAKYTPDGGRISISAGREDGHALISVKDNGLGIAPDMQEHVFDRFTQVNAPSDRSASGLGLGLALVRSLLEMHGGEIELLSEGANQGSDFRVRLPIVEPPHTEAERDEKDETVSAAAVSTECGRRILVVDDNRAAREMLAMVLESAGFDVYSADDGESGVAAAAELRPDAILLDLGLPRMDGYEAAREIRRQPGGGSIHLIALTGWGQDADKRRTQEAGFDRHLVKPLGSAELLQVLNDGKQREQS